jgi:hypothetical protein
MIKIENVVTPSPEQWKAIIRGMRHAMNSWDKSDSYVSYVDDAAVHGEAPHCFVMGEEDRILAERLAEAGSDHRKFMRAIQVSMDITAPLYWWKEADTYKVGTVTLSCSTMHKIHAKEFVLDDFSRDRMTADGVETLMAVIEHLNQFRQYYLETKDKDYWYDMIQSLPSSYNQLRTVFLNYETLRNIYHARRNHKLDEWHVLCERIEDLPYSELITG